MIARVIGILLGPLGKVLLGLLAVVGIRWDATRDARKDIVNDMKEADRETAQDLRRDVDDARRAGRVRTGPDDRGFRD